MKKLSIIICLMVFATQSIFALSATRSRAESKFLTDKMAYELNLSRAQIEDVYEINYDFFRSLSSARLDCSTQLQLRFNELRWVLNRYQWEYFLETDYFLYPVYVSKNKFMYKIYSYYNSSKYYYSTPQAYRTYNGAHYNRNYYSSRADQHYNITMNRPIAIRNTRSDNRYSTGYNNAGRIDVKYNSGSHKTVTGNSGNRNNSATTTRGESHSGNNNRTYQSSSSRNVNQSSRNTERSSSRTTTTTTTTTTRSSSTGTSRSESHSNGNRRK